MSEYNLNVAMAKLVCPICGRPCEDTIIVGKRLTKKPSKKIKEMEGQPVGVSDNACNECEQHKDEVVFLIEVDAEKSERNNPYRTGKIWGITKEAQYFVEHPEYIFETKNGVRYCFADIEFCKDNGLHGHLNK